MISVIFVFFSAASSEVVCLSGPSETNQIGYVSMSVDGHYIEALSEFEYRSDPVITKASRFTSINRYVPWWMYHFCSYDNCSGDEC